jgi:hypothetical protein
MSERIKETFDRRDLTVEATMEIDVAAAIEPVFDFVSAEDVLPKVLTGYGLLPPVERTSGNTEPWDQPGSSRTVVPSENLFRGGFAGIMELGHARG